MMMMMMMILIQAMHGIPYEPSLKRCLTLPFTSPLPHNPSRGAYNSHISSHPRSSKHTSAIQAVFVQVYNIAAAHNLALNERRHDVSLQRQP